MIALLLFYIEKHINNLLISTLFLKQMASSSSSSSLCVICPRPEDASLLAMQETRISQYIWNGHHDQVLVVRGKFSTHSRGEQIPA